MVSNTRRTTSTTTTNNNCTKLFTKLFLMSTPGVGTLFPAAPKRPAEGEAERAAQRQCLDTNLCYTCDDAGEEELTATTVARRVGEEQKVATPAATEEPAAAAPRRRLDATNTIREGHATLFGARDVTKFKTIKFTKEFCNDLAAGKADAISTFCGYMTAGPDRVGLYHCHEATSSNSKYFFEDGWDRIQPAFSIALDVDIPFVVMKQIAELLHMPLWQLCKKHDSKVLRGAGSNKTLKKGALSSPLSHRSISFSFSKLSSRFGSDILRASSL